MDYNCFFSLILKKTFVSLKQREMLFHEIKIAALLSGVAGQLLKSFLPAKKRKTPNIIGIPPAIKPTTGIPNTISNNRIINPTNIRTLAIIFIKIPLIFFTGIFDSSCFPLLEICNLRNTTIIKKKLIYLIAVFFCIETPVFPGRYAI